MQLRPTTRRQTIRAIRRQTHRKYSKQKCDEAYGNFANRAPWSATVPLQEMTRLPFDPLLHLEAEEPLGASGTSVSRHLPLRKPGPGLAGARGGAGRTSRSNRPLPAPKYQCHFQGESGLPSPLDPLFLSAASGLSQGPMSSLRTPSVGHSLWAPWGCRLSRGNPRPRGRGAGRDPGNSFSGDSRGARWEASMGWSRGGLLQELGAWQSEMG